MPVEHTDTFFSQQGTGIDHIFPVGPYMDRLVKTAGDGLTPPRVTRKNTVSPHVSRPALDMELYVPLLLIHGNDLLFLISGLF